MVTLRKNVSKQLSMT